MGETLTKSRIIARQLLSNNMMEQQNDIRRQSRQQSKPTLASLWDNIVLLIQTIYDKLCTTILSKEIRGHKDVRRRRNSETSNWTVKHLNISTSKINFEHQSSRKLKPSNIKTLGLSNLQDSRRRSWPRLPKEDDTMKTSLHYHETTSCFKALMQYMKNVKKIFHIFNTCCKLSRQKTCFSSSPPMFFFVLLVSIPSIHYLNVSRLTGL